MSAVGKYDRRVDRANSLLCVGLDSDYEQIPERFKEAGLPQFAFNQWIIEKTYPHVSAYKLNMAFYEARGDEGIRALKLTLEYLSDHHPDILTICDAKRGDIGSTNEGYASAIFDWFGFDAATLSPYLGQEALSAFLGRADRGCIILCRTSNPGAGEFQDLEIDGKPLWQIVAERVSSDWNRNGNCMLVAGATYPAELKAIRRIVGDMTLLVPGIGAQGGNVEQTVRAGLNAHGRGMIINSSRAILFADDPAHAARSLRDAINEFRQ
jgi:orotidine-5'-phosphate decarboxylase